MNGQSVRHNILPFILTIAGVPGISYADTLMSPDTSFSPLDISLSAGWLGGESREYVYDTISGRKLSQLNWKIRRVPVLKAGITLDIGNWLTVNAGGWASLSSGYGVMDDYDWLGTGGSGWNNWSHHPYTHVNYANEYDVNLKFWLIRHAHFRVGLMSGFQQTRFSWTADGGHYDYYNHTHTGNFPPGPNIGYSQNFSVPYTGLVGQYWYQNFELNARVKYSPLVSARDSDEHYARQIIFRDRINHSRYYSAGFDIGYYLSSSLKLITGITYSVFGEGKGCTEIVSSDKRHEYIKGDAAGISSKDYVITAGFSYLF